MQQDGANQVKLAVPQSTPIQTMDISRHGLVAPLLCFLRHEYVNYTTSRTSKLPVFTM